MVVMYDYGGSDNSPGGSIAIGTIGPPNLRFKQADNPTVDTNNPVVIPAAGTGYSYWKQIYLACTVAPDTQVDNVQFYTDGTSFQTTNCLVVVGLQFPVRSDGVTTGYDVADGSAVMTTHTDISGTADAFDYTSGATLSGPSISESGTLIDAVGETTNYLVLQLLVTSSATPGDQANETFTFQYDEI